MLVLSRKCDERIRLRVGGETIWVKLVEVDRGKVRLGFEASRAVEIVREELIEPKEAPNQER